MSVLQMTPCVLVDTWSAFVEWSATVFDLPVTCQFDDQGWARLTASSPGITVIDREVFAESAAGQATVLELEVTSLARSTKRALAHGATTITAPRALSDGQWHAAIETPQGIVLWLYQSAAVAPKPEVGQGPVHFTIARTIAAPVERVFAAVTRAEDLTAFFIDDASGDLADGQTVEWIWNAYGSGALDVVSFRPDTHVTFHWQANYVPYQTRVRFAVAPEGDKTRISVTETGWGEGRRDLASAFDNADGWSQFATRLKLYLEHGISLKD